MKNRENVSDVSIDIKDDAFKKGMMEVRNLIIVALGVTEGLRDKAEQEQTEPGTKFLLGAVIRRLSHAKAATGVNITALNLKHL